MNQEHSYHGKINQDINWRILGSSIVGLPSLLMPLGVLGAVLRFDLKDLVLSTIMSIFFFSLFQKTLVFYSDITISENGLIFRHVNFSYEKRNYSWDKLQSLEIYADKSVLNINWEKVNKFFWYYLLPNNMKGLPITNAISGYEILIEQISENLKTKDVRRESSSPK